jgi:hypothetical protein
MFKPHALTSRRAITAAVVAVASLFATPAMAEETVCVGTIGAVSLDNVLVPDGATCMLDGTRLNGNIVVGTAASLDAVRVTVNGNVQAEGANSVAVRGRSSIGGSIQIVQGFSAVIANSRINGDVLFDENKAPLRASRNSIGGNLQAFKNTGGLHINDNVIKGNLQCKENVPTPTGSGNSASSKEDQCAAL